MKARGFLFVSLAAASILGVACAQGSRITDEPVGGEDGAGATGGNGGAASQGGGSSTGGGPTTGTTSTTGTGSTETATADAGVDGGDGGGDAGPPCSEDPCKLVAPQCGCDPGEACIVKPSGRSCAKAGPVTWGQKCTGLEKCEPGLLCVNNSATVATCMRFCASDAECQPPGGLCLLKLSDGNDGEIPDATLCTENCDPVTSTGCPVEGTGCQLGREPDGQERFFTRCLGAGKGKQDEPCASVTDCAPGHSCFTLDAQDVCLELCEVGAPAPCPGGAQCAPIDIDGQSVQIGNIQYGACVTL